MTRELNNKILTEEGLNHYLYVTKTIKTKITISKQKFHFIFPSKTLKGTFPWHLTKEKTNNFSTRFTELIYIFHNDII